MPKDPLKFKVAPHIVEDLGLNLYTNLPRVLVEFVANAYDADSPHARISLDENAIKQARQVLKREYELEEAQNKGTNSPIQPLAARTLPEDLQIAIADQGHGMSRDDLDNKFLFAGRRRRREEPNAQGRSPKGRPLMGRKGLGKLAGFGVAKLIEVVTRREGQAHATKITLDFDELIKRRAVHEIEVEEETLSDGGGFARSGTRIILSRLLYEPLKSHQQTIENEIAEHFELIDPREFVAELNGQGMQPRRRTHAYAWPRPELPIPDLVNHSLDREGGGTITFRYRLRFTSNNEALPAARRGIRVYARQRLAAAPSLLGADTNMHGFRMTDYLDGVVQADFIEDEDTDYIATDRNSLRWETPLLSGLYDFLGEQIKEACKNYQRKRDEDAPNIVEQDRFTIQEIEKYELSKRDRKLALRFAAILQSSCKRGADDPVYKTKLPGLIRGVGHGTILTAIADLADQAHPNLDRVAVEVAKLTKDELDQFVSSVKGRLKAMEALRKIVQDVDFKAKRDEKTIQKMFEGSPWMVDPTYTQFLTGDRRLDVLFTRLAKELAIGSYAPDKAENDAKRPDLVFLIGNLSLARLVIVELKAPNATLEVDHLVQLEYYMERAEEWLTQHDRGGMSVHGHLIGSKARPQSRAEGAVGLRGRIKKAGPNTAWKVRDYIDVLSDTEAAHLELLEIHRRAEEEA